MTGIPNLHRVVVSIEIETIMVQAPYCSTGFIEVYDCWVLGPFGGAEVFPALSKII